MCIPRLFANTSSSISIAKALESPMTFLAVGGISYSVTYCISLDNTKPVGSDKRGFVLTLSLSS